MKRNDVVTLILFCSVYIAWGLTDSIQAPFYPIVAESKGAHVGEYGFVFGIIHLAIFFAGPIFGKYMGKLGLRNVYIFGVVSTGVCALLFGFLGFVEDKVLFLLFSYGLRVLEGIAEVNKKLNNTFTVISLAFDFFRPRHGAPCLPCSSRCSPTTSRPSTLSQRLHSAFQRCWDRLWARSSLQLEDLPSLSKYVGYYVLLRVRRLLTCNTYLRLT
jgi:hypothetical protein